MCARYMNRDKKRKKQVYKDKFGAIGTFKIKTCPEVLV